MRHWRIVFSILALLLLYAGLVLGGVSEAQAPIIWMVGDKLDWESHRLAGWRATNCGRLPGHAHEVSRCVVACLTDKVPFRLRYDWIGIDEANAIGVVGGRDGRLYTLSSAGGRPTGRVDLLYQSVTVRPCEEPIDLSKHTERDEIPWIPCLTF